MKDTLDAADKKLQILDEERLGVALDAFVAKEQKQMIDETVSKIVSVQQKKLVKRGVDADEKADKEQGDGKITTQNALIEACQAETQKIRDSQFSIDIDEEVDDDNCNGQSMKMKKAPTKKGGRKEVESDSEVDFDYDDNIIIDDSPPQKRGMKRNESSQISSRIKRARSNLTKRTTYESDDEDDVIESDDVSPMPKRSNGTARAARGSRRATTKKSYREDPIEIDDDDDEDDGMDWGVGTQSSQTSSRRANRRR